jgi:hypothetical protein
VPQVKPIRALADPSKWRHTERPADQRCRIRDGRDQHSGRQREQHQPAAVQEERVLRGPHHQERHGDQGHDGRDVDDHPSDQLDPQRVAEGAVDHGERCADEQLTGPGVGALVRPRVVEARAGEQRQQDEGDRGQHDGPSGDLQHRQPAEAQDEEQRERPEQVELLLHGEGPQVVQWPRPREVVEVGHVAGDRGPVADVEDRRQGLVPALVERAPLRQRGRAQDDQKHQHEAGKQSPGPVDPEASEVEASRPLVGGEQYPGDQASAEGEEDPNAQQTTGQPGDAEVIAEDREDCDGADAVESREVRARRAHRSWQGPPPRCRLTLAPGRGPPAGRAAASRREMSTTSPRPRRDG